MHMDKNSLDHYLILKKLDCVFLLSLENVQSQVVNANMLMVKHN
jgi:hypothetical protein